MKRNKHTHTDKSAKMAQIQPEKQKSLKKKGSAYMLRAFGVFLIGMGGSLYVQAMPLLFVFIGGILGVHPSAKPSDMDTIIWIMTCVSILIPLMLGFIAWNRYVWRRFVKQPTPLFNQTKHAA